MTEVINVDASFAKRLLPPLNEKENKYTRGKVLILAGSKDYPGAGVLSANAALRAGAGHVTLSRAGITHIGSEKPELILLDLNTHFWTDIKFDSVLVGPGFGVNPFTKKIITTLQSTGIKNVVLDADALTVSANEKLYLFPSSWVLTPHTGELSRLLNISSETIESDREKFILKAHQELGGTILLKGHQTLICGDESKIYKITSGNSGLAKSGTGDALAGMITALLAQKLNSVDAAILGAYVHGACADLWVKKSKDPLSLLASDVIELLPEVYFNLRK